MRGSMALVSMWIILATTYPLSDQLSSGRSNNECDPETQYKHFGRCCNQCQPGTYKISWCSSESDTKCNQCGENEFNTVWNTEDKCKRHVVCDPGKGLVVAHSGNSTYPRKCVCVADYHWNTQSEFCMKNKECAPGFGVQHPVHTNKDTLCIACPVGFFSNSSSSTEECKPWTNCLELGLVELARGTSRSDMVCEKSNVISSNSWVVIIVIISVILSVPLITFICFVCCKKKVKKLTADIQKWINEVWSRSCGAKENFPPNSKNTEVDIQDKFAMDALVGENDLFCTQGYSILGQENSTPLSIRSEGLIAEDQGRRSPTEDEYMEKILFCRSQVGKSKSSIAGEETMSDSDYSSHDSGRNPASPDCCTQRLPCRLCQRICQDGHTINPLHACEQLQGRATKEDLHPRNVSTEHLESMSGHSMWCPSSMDFSQAPHSSPVTDAGEETYYHSTSSQHTSGSSPEERATSEAPLQSGNVTGNNNSTFISNGQVMNFNGDVIFVVVSPNSQEVPTNSENTEENMGNPVQEESQSRCDSFVANTQNPTDKYADILSATNAEWWKPSAELGGKSGGPDSFEQRPDTQQNLVFTPVQEEGKPEYFHFEEWI